MIADSMKTGSILRESMRRLRPLRVMLIACAAVVIVAAPFADGSVHMHDWRLLPGVVAPTIMMMLVFALPLDMTMAGVFMVDADAVERARLQFVIRVEATVFVCMIAAWLPFLFNVLELSPFT